MANAKKLIKEASLFLKIESNRISHLLDTRHGVEWIRLIKEASCLFLSSIHSLLMQLINFGIFAPLADLRAHRI